MFACASVWWKWLDPSDTAGFVSLLTTRQARAVRALGFGVVHLGGAAMAHLALSPSPLVPLHCHLGCDAEQLVGLRNEL